MKIQEHIDKMNNIKQQIKNSKGKQRKQYKKRLHRLIKQALEYYRLTNNMSDINYIKLIKG